MPIFQPSGRDFCEMTVVPGGVIEYASDQSVVLGQGNQGMGPAGWYGKFKKPRPFYPVWVAALNRTVALTPVALSHNYDERIRGFQTAYNPLLEFLKQKAFEYEQSGNTRTTLFLDGYSDKLVAFCSTKCSCLKVRGDKILSLCPSIEVAALCVDDRFRFKGVGQAIFRDILQRIHTIKNWTGVQMITLFAIPDAVGFYQKLNFRRLSKGMKILYSPAHLGCVPMYLPLEDTGAGG